MAKKRSSSKAWLREHRDDSYVQRAQREGYRSRACYKLLELQERDRLIRPGMTVVDLGSAPGGWSQVAAELTGDRGRVVASDILPMDSLAGVTFIQGDFTEDSVFDAICAELEGKGADVVLSDMAAPTTGHRSTDHLRIVALAEAALDYAEDVLAPGGAFVCKVFAGGAEGDLLNRLKQNFTSVKHAKPKASRSDSAEKYVVATGFRGRA